MGEAASPLTLEGNGPLGCREVLCGGPAGLQQQGKQSVGQPHVAGLRATIERGQGPGWADGSQRERKVVSALEGVTAREGGREGPREEERLEEEAGAGPGLEGRPGSPPAQE